MLMVLFEGTNGTKVTMANSAFNDADVESECENHY